VTPGQEPELPHPVDDLGLTDALVQLSFVVQSALGRIATDHGLSIAQVKVLGVLRDREPGIQQLARHLDVDKSSVSGLIDRAERKGLVRRLAASEDGRAVRVSPTSKGRTIMAAVETDVTSALTRLARTLSPSEQRELSKLASRIALVDSTIDDRDADASVRRSRSQKR
jgi:DNA-binding MarR family transcriptional regulator